MMADLFTILESMPESTEEAFKLRHPSEVVETSMLKERAAMRTWFAELQRAFQVIIPALETWHGPEFTETPQWMKPLYEMHRLLQLLSPENTAPLTPTENSL